VDFKRPAIDQFIQFGERLWIAIRWREADLATLDGGLDGLDGGP
jgi:hypothetical protein